MVIKFKTAAKSQPQRGAGGPTESCARCRGAARAPGRGSGLRTRLAVRGTSEAAELCPRCQDVVVVKSDGAAHYGPGWDTRYGHEGQQGRSAHESEEGAGDVIDLGAPRLLRRAPPDLPPRHARVARLPRAYTPNPRLYPGLPNSKPKLKRPEGRGRRRKRTFRRPVPNARLYRPAPRRAPPAPPAPVTPVAPVAPVARWAPAAPRTLDTASRAALRLAERRQAGGPVAAGGPASRLVVTLPAPRPSRPAMDASPSPEDGSDGNDPVSAPSEFLAEFLSAIMQRQYAEALRYCHLILRYEPHNATARGFRPLLQHKVAALQRAADEEWRRGDSSSPDSSAGGRCGPHAPAHRRATHEAMQQEADGSESGSGRRVSSDDSCASQSSLELDSSASRTERTSSASGSGGGWESTSRSTPDDNGNAPPPAADAAHASLTPHTGGLQADDVENDNKQSACVQSDSSTETLRRLRAQFTCSIK